MTPSRTLSLLTLLLLSAFVAAPASAVEVRVTIENLAPEGGNFLTPVWVGFHDGTFDSYDGGAPLRGTVERIAEDGNTGPLTDEFDLEFGTPQATIPGPNGPIAPGDTAELIIDLDSSDAVRYFSYVSMIIPSNDAFIANGPPKAHQVFDAAGNFTPFSFVLRAANGDVNDGGTEVNDELPANTAFFGQATPDTGVDEDGVVTTHPGFNAVGSGGILDSDRFANADFNAPGYAIARISVQPVRGSSTKFTGDGSQEVPAVASGASAACEANLTSDESTFTFSCEHNVDDVIFVHVHQGARGENGDVMFNFDEDNLASPTSQSFDATPELVEAFRNGNLYVNIHSEAFPSGAVRAQADGCIAGPTSLCLNDHRFQVSATFETATNNGDAKGFELTEDSGVFYFFRPSNIELDVKVLNGCEETGFYWVFAAGLTNQGVELTVLDTESGTSRSYENTLDEQFAPILDTRALDVCP